MSIAAVRDYLTPFGLADKILEFSTSSATVELAAQAAGVIPARIAKSLSFKVEDRAVLIIAAGDAKVNNPKFKAAFHTKAKCSPGEEVTDLVGHAIGGVCPFAIKGHRRCVPGHLLQRFDTVFPAAGSATAPWSSPATSWPSAPRTSGAGGLLQKAGRRILKFFPSSLRRQTRLKPFLPPVKSLLAD